MTVPTMPNPEALLEHAGFIRSLARTLVRDESVADDVVQQTYLAALQNPPAHTSNLRGWLAKVARNFAFRALRTEQRTKRREEASVPREPAPSPAEVAARLELQRKVVEAVMALEEPYRSTVVLRFFDDCTPEEIARRMGVPKETVRTRLRRAVERMRGGLDEAHGGSRRAWVLALAPLAGLGTREATAAAATTALSKAVAGKTTITGGLIVSSKAFWTLTAAILVAAVLFVWQRSDAQPAAPRTARIESGETAGVVPAAQGGESGASRPEVAPGTERDDAFVLRATIRGDRGTPLPGAVARLGKAESRADADGLVELKGFGFGLQEVAVHHEGYVPLRRQLDPLLEGTQEIRLVRGAPLALIIVGPDGAPLKGVAVRSFLVDEVGVAGLWSQTRTDFLAETTTGGKGRVDLGAVPVGVVKVRLADPRFAPRVLRIEIAGREVVTKRIKLDRGATVRGRVTSPSGAAVAGARVFAMGYERFGATTDKAGRYELERVGSGPQKIYAKAKGFGTGYFGASGWGEPVDLHVAAGDSLDSIDIVVPEALFVTGRVLDTAGAKPVQGVLGTLHVSAPPWTTVSFKTDAEGRFRVGPLTLTRSRTVRVFFAKTGYTIDNVHQLPTGPELAIGDVLARPGGRVAGRVIDTEGRPVRRARVWLLPARRMVAVDKQGRFTSAALPPARYSIEAEAPGYRSRRVAADGRWEKEIELVLRKALPIAGRVLTPDGRPRVNVRVVAVPKDSDVIAGSARTDAEGRFEIESLPEGDYRVGVRRGNKTLAAVETRAGSDVELRLPISGAMVTGRVVSATTGQPIRQFRAKFIRYRLMIPDGFDSGRFASAEGRFDHELNKAGMIGIEIEAAGYARTRPRLFRLESGATTDLGTIKLGIGGAVKGQVVDHQGQPVPFTRIHFLSSTFETNKEPPFTDREGRFQVRGVSEGVYNFFAVSPQHPLAVARSVRVQQGETTRLQFRFAQKAPLTVVVLDQNGQPVRGVELSYSFASVAPLKSDMFRQYEPPGWGKHATDANGIVVKPALPATKVTIYLERKDFRPVSRVVSLDPGKPTRLEVRLEPR